MCHGEVTRYVTEGVTRPRPDPTHISLTHCMTVTGGTAQTRGQSDVSSCNATNSIEHLDWQPPCDGVRHADTNPPAIAIAICRTWCPCPNDVRLLCQQCLDIGTRPASKLGWHCTNCMAISWDDSPVIIRWEPLR